MTDAKLVNAETGEVTVLMTAEEAETKTLKAQQYMGMVCHLVKELHDKQAWRALGYPSWVAYCKDRFNVGKSRSYQLIGYAETIALGTKATGLPESTIVDSLPEATARSIDRAALADLLDEAYGNLDPDAAIGTRRELWDAVLDQITKDSGDGTPAPPPPDAPDDPAPASSSGEAPVPEDVPPPAPAPQQVSPLGPAAGTPGEAGTEPPTDAAAPGTDGTGLASHTDGEDREGQDTPTDPPAPPVLPDDWRKRLACSVHLLGCPIDLLRPELTGDDRIDLGDLRDYLTDLLDTQEQNP